MTPGGGGSGLRRGVTILGLLAVGTAAGCGDGPGVTRPEAPAVTRIDAVPNPQNALSLLVDVASSGLATARALAWIPGDPPDSTPVRSVAGGAFRLAVLGLEAETAYRVAVEGWGERGEPVVSDTVEATTGALPDYLRYQADLLIGTMTGTVPGGYVVANLRRQPDAQYTVAFDFTGKLRWYRRWDQVGSFGEQGKDGNFVVFTGGTTGFTPLYGYYTEIAPDGEVVRTHRAPPLFYTDNHEILLTPGVGGPTAHFLSYDIRFLDLSDHGGSSRARVAGHQILRTGPGGDLEFRWDAWDHLDLDDWVLGTSPAACTLCDFDHPNSLDLDHDGNYILSVRNLSQVVKIDSRTGAVLWKLGGRSGEFTFSNDPDNGPSGQHCVRVLDSGHLLLYDNGTEHVPQETRVVEYSLDEDSRTATRVWEFRHVPAVYTPGLGSVQRLRNGNTFIGFGGAGLASLVDPAGMVLWEAELMIDDVPATRTYRFQDIVSLYDFEAP